MCRPEFFAIRSRKYTTQQKIENTLEHIQNCAIFRTSQLDEKLSQIKNQKSI